MWRFILVDTAAIRQLEVFVDFFQLYLEPYAVDFADETARQFCYILRTVNPFATWN